VKALFLLGPTASGKTAAALALAERFPVEVISVDSAQVYRDMDVGTAKPSREERARVPHHLIDILDPTQATRPGAFATTRSAWWERSRNAAGFRCSPAARCSISARSPRVSRTCRRPSPRCAPSSKPKRPAKAGLRCMRSLRASILPRRGALSPRTRSASSARWRCTGTTGRALSALQDEGRRSAPPFETLRIALEPSDRGVLHARIAERFRRMLDEGLVAELDVLRRRYRLDAAKPSMRAVGYRQVWETLEGIAPEATLEARGIAATRQLAKRQLTWLRAMDGIERFDCLRADLAQAVGNRAAAFLGA
jgi:tRNA dimethylallyltransferase